MDDKSIFVAPESKTNTPLQLFNIWVASNIGVLGLVYGAVIVSFNLSFIQSIIAAFVSASSFILVGYLSLAGKIGNTTMFNLSRAVFGVRGNYIPTLCAWINLTGWMCINVITGSLTLLALINLFVVENSSPVKITCLILFSILIAIFSLFNQDNLAKLQTFFTYIFGVLTILVLFFIISKTNWSVLLEMKNGSWINGFLPAVSIICAGSSISWAIVAADYSVYQKPSTTNNQIILVTTLGGFIPMMILMTIGILMTSTVPDFSDSKNPIALIGEQLPSWMTIPYLLTALVGLIAPSVISLRSARLNLSTLNIKVKDTTAVGMHVILMLTIGIYVLLWSDNFIDALTSFLGFIGIALAAWCATFLMDFALIRKKTGYDKDLLTGDNNVNSFNYNGLISWFVGAIVGLIFTIDPAAEHIFDNKGWGLLAAFFASAICFSILYKLGLFSKSRSSQ